MRVASLRARFVLLSLVSLLLAATTVGLTSRSAEAASRIRKPSTCPIVNPDCVVVGTGTNPGGGGGGNSGGGDGHRSGGGGGRPAPPDPCAGAGSGYAYVACRGLIGKDGDKVNQATQACIALEQGLKNTTTLALLNATLVAAGCPAAPRALVPPSPIELAQRVLKSFLLPSPAGHRSPDETLTDQRIPYTYVHLWTWFRTDEWTPSSATARAGGNYATVTAQPVSLTYTPGDGGAPVVCDGPGRAWTNADGDNAPSGGACGYQYQHATGPGYDNPVTSTQTVTWRLTWTGSGNQSGTFTSRTTSTRGRLNVLQIQVVVR